MGVVLRDIRPKLLRSNGPKLELHGWLAGQSANEYIKEYEYILASFSVE